MRVPIVAMIVVACLSACGGRPVQPSDGAQRDLVFSSGDGVSLHATLYEPAKPFQNPPGLVLVHMVGSNRVAWEAFAARAGKAGYLCMAFDARGHGESTTRGEERISYRQFETKDWMAVISDIAAAHKALLENGADPSNVAVVGASIGANLALHYALAHTDVAATVMVSPGLDYKGVETEQAIRDLGKRPVLLVSSQGDSYAAESCTALKKAASGLCELREYAGSAHGTNLLDGATNAIDDILLWLRPIIASQQEHSGG